MKYKKKWEFKKIVLPQHTDHAGVMWHGAYLNWLEESRMEALSESGMKYEDLIKKGYDLPVINLQIKYKSPIRLGEEINIHTLFKTNKGPKIIVESSFMNVENITVTNVITTIVLIETENFKIVRNKPRYLSKYFENLDHGDY
tara:strand:+ start:2405 stop:2833 length:429 start_codon:yes stop_codon:yes gene_type:complete